GKEREGKEKEKKKEEEAGKKKKEEKKKDKKKGKRKTLQSVGNVRCVKEPATRPASPWPGD
ncbi:hypothetical protein HUC28_23385, partial [Escherichia coli]|nr:hypothetical protein [Escherichia coli]